MKAKGFKTWSGRPDLNRRPLAPKASALPGCATSRRYEHSTLSEHPAVAQLLDDEPYRLPAVADPVLLLGGVLGHRPPGALDEKDRVVPETGRSSRDGHDLPFDAPGALRHHPGGKSGSRNAGERGRPRPGKGFQFLEKHRVVFLVGRLGGRPARPPTARSRPRCRGYCTPSRNGAPCSSRSPRRIFPPLAAPLRSAGRAASGPRRSAAAPTRAMP